MSRANALACVINSLAGTTELTSPPCAGGFSVKEVAAERQLLSARNADHARQFLGEPPAGHDADAGMRIGKAGIGGGNQDVAGNGNLEPPGDGNTVDRSDHWLATNLDRLDRIFIGALCIRCTQIAGVRSQFFEVEACGKSAFAAPVRMTQRTLSSASTARIALANSLRSARDKAFIASGRLRVTMAMPSSISVVTSAIRAG